MNRRKRAIARTEVIIDGDVMMAVYNPLSFRQTLAKNLLEDRIGTKALFPSGSYVCEVTIGKRGLNIWLHETKR